MTWKKKITQACDTVTFKESAIRFLQEKVDKHGGMAGMSDELFDEQVTSIMFEHDQQALVLNQIHQSTKVYSCCIHVYIYKYTHIICSDRERERERCA